MSTNGILDFQNTNKVIFRGTDSNVVVDTSNASIGIGIQGTEKPGSNLHVIGDASISSNLKLTTDTSITVNSNVVTDFNGPHARLPITQAIVEHPIMHIDKTAERPTLWTANDNSSNISVKAGYTVTASTVFNSGVSNFDVFRLYDGHPDGNAGTYYCSGGTAGNGTSYSTTSGLYRDTTTSGGYSGYGGTPITTTVSGVSKAGEWLGIETPHPIVLKYVTMTSESHETYAHASPHKGVFAGSHDGVTWESISTFDDFMAGTDGTTRGNGNGTTDINIGPHRLDVNSTTAYKYHRMIVEAIQTTYGSAGGGAYLILDEMRWYGCNDNPPAGDISVDTTFKSVMNTPQTTGANVYVDAKLSSDFTNQVTGPTGVGSAVTHDSTNKYWEMNGQLTSNITVEANTFLEGDQPHAVSVWFNSSNLEANVSNTCVFSISDQEKLDSVNLDLQSNTWHNLTYAYQGEGGSRVTYLDGRKVEEAQVEDTFGDYPPFAMTGYSQGGYVVSASSEQSSTRASWKAFNDVQNVSNATEDNWESGAKYSSGPPYNANQTTYITDTNGTPHYGEWIAIEMPEKLKFGYFNMVSPVANRRPDSMVIVGSNDGGVTFDHIKTISSVTYPSNNTTTIAVNSAYAYNKFYFIVTSVDGANTVTNISHLAIYGHRENDLVRLPDPTNVLKYPHIAMTGYAQRGYTVTASSEYSDYLSWYAFDDRSEYVNNNKWVSQQNVYQNSSSYSGSNRLSYDKGGPASGTGSTVEGEWLAIELPNKIKVQSTKLVSYANTSEEPENFIIYGSNDNVNWVIVDDTYQNTSANIPIDLVGKIWTVSTAGSSVAYKYFGIVVTKIGGGTSVVAIKAWELYGTGVDSIPIQIGGGNIDKVANFRVYDKFVEEDQALEIWDAQKDEFGRAKSSMTLQKGRLGLGTEEPEGRLAVADEPDAPENEFPPRAGGFDGDEWYIEGHGTFKACTSNYHDSIKYYPGRAFTKSLTGDVGYASTADSGLARWLGNNGLPNQSSSDPVGTFQGHQGDWLELELPYRIRVKSFQIQTRLLSQSPGDHPKNGFLYGSNNRENWTQITEFTNLTYTPSQLDGIGAHKAIWNVNSETGFKYLRLLTTQKIDGSDAWLMISELKYFGTREQGQSILHDGALTLTKNLNVSRIGPALDADDTPRRDRLVVEYNTSTNPTFEGAVRDTSGRGNDGVFYGNATYDATEKAVDIAGTPNGQNAPTTSAFLEVGQRLPFKGNQAHTISFWFKKVNVGQNYTLVNMWKEGTNYATNGNSSGVMVLSSGQFQFWHFGGDLIYTDPGGDTLYGGWKHVVAIYTGETVGDQKLYVNGTEAALSSSTGLTNTLDLTNAKMTIGKDHYRGDYYNQANTEFSGIKVYDTALTAEEVKTLYDMGQCDEGHHVVNFSKTRVGISLGDGEAPRGALDVRGDIKVKNIQKNFAINKNGDIGNVDMFLKCSDDTYTGGGGMTIETGTGGKYWRMLASDYLSRGWLVFGYSTDNTSWVDRGYIDPTIGNNRMNFTGQHKTFIKDVPFSQADGLYGLIVSSDQNKYIKMSDGIEAGSNAITTNESLPIVSLSNVVTDKKCFGVISASEDPENRTEQYGAWGTNFEKEKGDTRVYINSVGEGAIWVVNTNGSLESGDYITTSNVAGYGQKQDDDILHNYTVAKITMDCDFEPATQPVQVIKKDEEGENILDEHDQIQWEDHPTETERAYKVRYLTADGIQTDEANAVHIAAFVGCTYHCG